MDRPGASDIVRRLVEICGPPFARLAGPADEVAGCPARWVAVPGDARAAARVLRLAAQHDLAVVPRGAGTKIDWGAAPARVDIVLDTGRLAGIDRPAGEPTEVEVGAGTPLRAIQATLGRSGHRLPLDPPSPGATIGGVLAADESGPLRLCHGGPGDQLLRLRYLDAGGELVTVRLDPADLPAGNGVDLTGTGVNPDLTGTGVNPDLAVTGVNPDLTVTGADPDLAATGVDPDFWAAGATGFDVELPATGGFHGGAGVALARLLCGSQGGLGLLVSATLRVREVPAGRRWVIRPVRDPAEARTLVLEVLDADLDPAAIELHLPADVGPRAFVHPDHPSVAGRSGLAGSVAVLLEGGLPEVDEQAARLVGMLGAETTVTRSAPDWWGRYPFGPADVALRIEAAPEHLYSALYALRDSAGGPVSVRGSFGSGVLHAALTGRLATVERAVRIVAAARAVLQPRQGRCVVVAAPAPVRDAVDIWGGPPGLPGLRDAKDRLDPHRRLAPGRLPGGL
ncbi:hypothetical protein GCM10012279_43860 [Micromonospora yangpuensis]|uniref:Glycolate oxidase FAD binding subunit n=2 Tax=Micromonosporaceae TaxID=28056 RepID=A0A1C6TZ43_9ACTN|nr:hypothetical protein GCM10012279_43860 [Micromonospora yangpuensis]SCL46943.1 glycolate oxidase FAD binding subunit [Micromonospora yangpuensis]